MLSWLVRCKLYPDRTQAISNKTPLPWAAAAEAATAASSRSLAAPPPPLHIRLNRTVD